MDQVKDTMSAKTREAGNKGAARKLRASGFVPAIAYGPTGTPRYLALDPKMFVMQHKLFGRSHIYNVNVEGGAPFKALIKEVQRDAVTRELLHIDLYAIDETRPIRVQVPIELTGKAAGIIDGGLVSQILRSVEVLCLPSQIPPKLIADVTPLKVGESFHLSDLVLPEGVKITAHGDEAVAIVAEPDAAPVATAADAATPAAGAASPAAAGGKAPAAGGKAPAAGGKAAAAPAAAKPGKK